MVLDPRDSVLIKATLNQIALFIMSQFKQNNNASLSLAESTTITAANQFNFPLSSFAIIFFAGQTIFFVNYCLFVFPCPKLRESVIENDLF